MSRNYIRRNIKISIAYSHSESLSTIGRNLHGKIDSLYFIIEPELDIKTNWYKCYQANGKLVNNKELNQIQNFVCSIFQKKGKNIEQWAKENNGLLDRTKTADSHLEAVKAVNKSIGNSVHFWRGDGTGK